MKKNKHQEFLKYKEIYRKIKLIKIININHLISQK